MNKNQKKLYMKDINAEFKNLKIDSMETAIKKEILYTMKNMLSDDKNKCIKFISIDNLDELVDMIEKYFIRTINGCVNEYIEVNKLQNREKER